ncbi:MAG TPA: ABC transporter permease [Candidatus Blautia faecavium]|uniref:ABC transporter permease n=1 Tax=Candidatus Blautia faecavium TaxID=2838487 RepID=A0A9D2LW15_9FIRM|nr:ABC transporter permease [Candidatus Blautia faecavium]
MKTSESSVRKSLANVHHSNGTKRAERAVSRAGLKALYRKELADHLTSKRFIIIFLLIWGTSIASLYGALSGIADVIESDSSFIFLKLYSTSGNSIPSFMSIIALLGPFLGLTLGFDAINSERSSGTLNRLVAQPIYRDSIIIGKFLAGATIIAIMVFSMGITIGTVGVLSTGLVPELEEVLRIFCYLVFTCIYIAFWLGLSIFFSVVCRHSATSALAVIALWIFFTIFMSLLASIIANAIYPMDNEFAALINSVDNYTCELNINRISPYYLYSEAASTIMNPSVRSVNVVTMSQIEGAISGYLDLGQSLLLVWPHLIGLFALMLAAFAGSFIGFMRQEIRSN